MRLPEVSERGGGAPHPEWQSHGKGNGGQGTPMCHKRKGMHPSGSSEGSYCLGPREGERAWSRTLIRAKEFLWEWAASMPSAGDHSVGSRASE